VKIFFIDFTSYKKSKKVSLSCNLNDVDLTVYCTVIIHVTKLFHPENKQNGFSLALGWKRFLIVAFSRCFKLLKPLKNPPKGIVDGLN